MSDDLVAAWRELLPELRRRYVPAKDAQRVPIELSHAFSKLNSLQRAELAPLLHDWIVSGDPSERFVGIAIARDNDVTSMIPTLRDLQDRLEESTEVGAPHEWAKVNRALGHLVSVEAAASDLTSESDS